MLAAASAFVVCFAICLLLFGLFCLGFFSQFCFSGYLPSFLANLMLGVCLLCTMRLQQACTNEVHTASQHSLMQSSCCICTYGFCKHLICPTTILIRAVELLCMYLAPLSLCTCLSNAFRAPLYPQPRGYSGNGSPWFERCSTQPRRCCYGSPRFKRRPQRRRRLPGDGSQRFERPSPQSRHYSGDGSPHLEHSFPRPWHGIPRIQRRSPQPRAVKH